MAKPKNEGFPYCQEDTDEFFDAKIRMLLAKFGCDGFGLWKYITDSIYKGKGYYVEWSEEQQELASADLFMSCEKIGLILDYLLKRTLLVSISYNGVKVLTSHGIQNRFQKMAFESRRNYYSKIDEIWLLEETDTIGSIFCTQKLDNSGIKAVNSGIKGDNSGFKRQRKEKKRKGLIDSNNSSNNEPYSEDKIIHQSINQSDQEDKRQGVALLAFLKAHPTIVSDINSPAQLYGKDFYLLEEKFKESGYLMDKTNSLSWVCRNYTDIIRDKYKSSTIQKERSEEDKWYPHKTVL